MRKSTNVPLLFDTATGQMLYRRLAQRMRRAFPWRSVGAWSLEMAGVGLLALGASMVYAPVGLIVIGLYSIIAANGAEEQ